jgi:hypothetical protein
MVQKMAFKQKSKIQNKEKKSIIIRQQEKLQRNFPIDE